MVSVLIYCHKITIIAQCCASMSCITQYVWLEADPYNNWVGQSEMTLAGPVIGEQYV